MYPLRGWEIKGEGKQREVPLLLCDSGGADAISFYSSANIGPSDDGFSIPLGDNTRQ